MRRGIMNGLNIGTAAVIATICGVALCMDYPTRDVGTAESHAGIFMFLMCASWLSCITSIYLGDQQRRMWDFRSSRIRCVLYSIIGSLLSITAFTGCETRATMVRIAEQMALSHNRAEMCGEHQPQHRLPREPRRSRCRRWRSRACRRTARR